MQGRQDPYYPTRQMAKVTMRRLSTWGMPVVFSIIDSRNSLEMIFHGAHHSGEVSYRDLTFHNTNTMASPILHLASLQLMPVAPIICLKKSANGHTVFEVLQKLRCEAELVLKPSF